MAKCKQCSKEYGSKRSTSVYCGPKCKQEFYRNRLVTLKPESVTVSNNKPVTVTEQDTVIVDACGTEHKIDYEDRCGVQIAVLDYWYNNKGTPYQHTRAHLGGLYDIIHGYRDKTGKPTGQMRRYLG